MYICYYSDNCANDWLEVINHKDWQMLEILDLSNCNINNENFKAVTNKKWPKLKKINLC
jgi:hypothetical protein